MGSLFVWVVCGNIFSCFFVQKRYRITNVKRLASILSLAESTATGVGYVLLMRINKVKLVVLSTPPPPHNRRPSSAPYHAPYTVRKFTAQRNSPILQLKTRLTEIYWLIVAEVGLHQTVPKQIVVIDFCICIYSCLNCVSRALPQVPDKRIHVYIWSLNIRTSMKSLSNKTTVY